MANLLSETEGGARTPPAVLVADDFDRTAELIGACLKQLGMLVFTATNGNEALSIALEHRPAICVLDAHLAGMPGWEIARKLRSQLGESRPRLVALTGDSALSRRRRAEFDLVLHKPVKLDQVLKALDLNG